jgi:hypothetical protein
MFDQRLILLPFLITDVLASTAEIRITSVSFQLHRPDDGDTTSETSVNVYQTTRRNIPEDSHLHTRRRENLKSHLLIYCLCRLSVPFYGFNPQPSGLLMSPFVPLFSEVASAVDLL